MRDYAEREAYGVTASSIEFVRTNLPKVGSIVKIECLLAGNTHTEFADLPDNYEQWVAFVDEEGNRIVVSGFSWGYAGEGPHGLFKMAQELGFDDLTIEEIAKSPKNEYWAWERERMQLTKDIAGYIISLQLVYDLEVGLTTEDYKLRNQLELEFPKLKWDREHREFNEWLWSFRVEAEPDVIEARVLLGGDIPFDDIYWADSKAHRRVAVDQNAPDSTSTLYREHSDIAGELFRETKEAAEDKLIAQDKAGKINLKGEWRMFQALEEQQRIVEQNDS